ncbi:hypothetical protein [Sporomusa termitida]|uniref:Uncharacterized protein n=1 Tax=Sporomusa termitida TaxID=2377 RepID=A0A517DT74_9FIRM|nr:hypothetical protein [Sporomusa termitida]QDR80563.1 hypothetical protein SPTER_18920 [Sporomusa termitida]
MVSVPKLDFACLDTATPEERNDADQKIAQWTAEILADLEKKLAGYNEKELNRYLQVVAKFSPFLPNAPKPLHFNQYFPLIVWYTLGNSLHFDQQRGRRIAFSANDINAFFSLFFHDYFTDSPHPDYFRPVRNLYDTKPFTDQFSGQSTERRKKEDYYALVKYLNEKRIIKLTQKTQSIKLHPWIGTTILYELCQFIQECSKMTGAETEWPPSLRCMILYELSLLQSQQSQNKE